MAGFIPAHARMPVRRIIEQASRIFGVPADIILSKRKMSPFVAARNAVCRAAYDAGWPATHIAKVMAGRDHSTILYARDRAEIFAERDPEYAAKLGELRAFAKEPVNIPHSGEVPAPIVVPPLKQNRPPVQPRQHDPDGVTAGMRERASRRKGSIELLAALRREHPERFAA